MEYIKTDRYKLKFFNGQESKEIIKMGEIAEMKAPPRIEFC